MGRTKKPVKFALVDAFTEMEFRGNPAAICLLKEERDEEWLQSLAIELNLPLTCYLTRIFDSDSPNKTRFQLRWFTAKTEVVLCGHATLAAAHFCFSSGLVSGHTIEFSTLFGKLTAEKVMEPKTQVSLNSENDKSEQPFFVELDLPAIPITNYNAEESSLISKLLGGVSVIDIKKTALDDLIVVLPTAKDVTDLQPQFDEIEKLTGIRGLIVSALAPSESEFDFFSRFLYPKLGYDEDAVCGSAHCALVLYWYKKLGKYEFLAYSASPRSGIMKVHLNELTNRVKLQGKAITVMEGSILV